MEHLSWAQVRELARSVADRWEHVALTGVYGVPRGGAVPAVLIAEHLNVPVVEAPGEGVLVVDDLVDSGATMERYAGHRFDALLRKSHSPAVPGAAVLDDWVVFPWEVGTDDEAGPADAVVRLLEHIGEDPTREGLADTPRRVLKALTEMTGGYQLNPADVLSTTFDVGSADELVVVRGVPFHSLCEHHLLPFSGTATVAYLPAGSRVVGLSKLARLVDLFARRLQVQERLTTQVAQALMDHAGARGAACIVTGTHHCMCARGVRVEGRMVTSSLLGVLRENSEARAELMALHS